MASTTDLPRLVFTPDPQPARPAAAAESGERVELPGGWHIRWEGALRSSAVLRGPAGQSIRMRGDEADALAAAIIGKINALEDALAPTPAGADPSPGVAAGLIDVLDSAAWSSAIAAETSDNEAEEVTRKSARADLDAAIAAKDARIAELEASLRAAGGAPRGEGAK